MVGDVIMMRWPLASAIFCICNLRKIIIRVKEIKKEKRRHT